MTLVLDEIRELPIMPLHLPEPNDSRLKAIVTGIKEDLGNRRTLEDWGKESGMSISRSHTLGRETAGD